jgi:Domain of unknown function (DUF6894)
MRRFYFHLRAGDELVPDEEGIDLSDLSAARREAIEAARELLAEAIKDGRAEVPEAFVIADEEGREIDTVPLSGSAGELEEIMPRFEGQPNKDRESREIMLAE